MDREEIHRMYVRSIRKSKCRDPFPGIVWKWEYIYKDFVSAEGLDCTIFLLLGSEQHDGKKWPKGKCSIQIMGRIYHPNQQKYYEEIIEIPATEDVFDVVSKAIENSKRNLLANPKYLADMESKELRSIFTPTPWAKKPNRL